MKTSNPKYLVIADYVTSKNDGQRHFITCNQLMQLYAVHEEECICAESSVRGVYSPPLEYYQKRYGPLTILRPRYDGDYRLPEGK